MKTCLQVPANAQTADHAEWIGPDRAGRKRGFNLPARLIWILPLLFAMTAAAQLPPQRSTQYSGADTSRTVFPHRPEYDAATNLTVEAWVFLGRPGHATYTNRFHTIVSRNWQESLWFGITSGSRLRFYRSGGIGMFKDSTNTVPALRWTHVAASYDGARVHFYIDGRPAGNEPLGHAGINKAHQLVLGNDVNGGLGLYGYLDEVRLWSVARTEAEIAQNRFVELESAAGLVARFPAGGRENTVAGVPGTETAVSRQIWGVLPRDYVAPRSPVAVNYDQNLDEFINAGAERIVWRYRTATGAERDGEGYLMYRDSGSDRNLYAVVPYTSLAASDLGGFQRLNFSLLFAPAPPEGAPPTAPATNHVRVDSPANFTLAPALLRGGAAGWTTQTAPARGAGSWDVVPAAGCEFDCARIFRIPVSLLGEFSQQPKPVLFGQFAYGMPALFLPAYRLPAPLDGHPDNPSTWARLTFGGEPSFPPYVRVMGGVTNMTAGAALPLEGLEIRLTNPANGTEFARVTTDRNGRFDFSTLIYPANAPLRLTCATPGGPGLWRALEPVVLSTPYPAIQPVHLDPVQGVTYTNRGISGYGTILIGSVAFPMIQHRSPALAEATPDRGTPRITLRTSPVKVTEPTEILLRGANLHPHCAFYLSHGNGAAPVNPGDPLPAGSTVTNFPLTVVERAADWSWVRLRLDFGLSPAWDAPGRGWLQGPYRILARDEWVGAWRRLEAGFLLDHEYPRVFGFPFDNELDGTQFDEFSNVYRWNAYDCVTLLGPFPGANPCLGCRAPNPLYTTFYSLVFTPWTELMTGSCLGMSATSLLFRRGELVPAAFEAPARYPAGFSTRRRTFPDGRTDELGPPKPQEHRFRVCDYSEPVNLWAHLHRNQAMQVTAEFLGSVLGQMDGTGAVPLGARGYSIAGNPVRTLNLLRSGGWVNHVLCFQDGADVFKSHAMVAWDAWDETGLDADTALVPEPAPGKTVLRVYDPNHPENAQRYFEIDRTANVYRYRFGEKPVVEGGVTNWVPAIWSGKGVYAVPLGLFRDAGTMPGADLLARGLALVLFGAADAEYVAADGGRWGYDAAGRIVETYEGARAIAPFGQAAAGPNPPAYAGRTAWFFPPTNRPPAEVRVRVRPQPDGGAGANSYEFFAGGGGATIHLRVEGAPQGALDRLRVGDTGGQLRSLRLEPANLRTNIKVHFGFNRGANPPLVMEYSGFRVGAGRSVQFQALPDHSGVEFRNESGEAAQLAVRLFRGSTNQSNLDVAVFGPILIPAGALHRLDLPGAALDTLRSALDVDGDDRYDLVTVLAPVPGVITEPATPRLAIGENGGRITVTWPVLPEPWVLESTEVLADATLWRPVDLPPRTEGRQQSVTFEGTDMSRIFRLRRLPVSAAKTTANTTYEAALHSWSFWTGREVLHLDFVTNVLIRRKDGSVTSATPTWNQISWFPAPPGYYRTWTYFRFASSVAPEEIDTVAFQGTGDGFHGCYVGVHADDPDAIPRRLFELPILLSERPDQILLNTPGHTNWLPALARNSPHLDKPYVTVEWTEESTNTQPPFNRDDRVIDWEDMVTTEIELTDGRTLILTLDPPDRRRPTWSSWPAPGYVDPYDPIHLRDRVPVRRYSQTLLLPEPLRAEQIVAVRTYNGQHVLHESRYFYEDPRYHPSLPLPDVSPASTVTHHVLPGESLRTRRNVWMTWPTFSARRVKLLAQEIFAGSATQPKTSLMRFEEPADLVDRFIWQREFRPRIIPPDARASIFAIQYLTGEDGMRTLPEIHPDLDLVPWPVYELITRFTSRLGGPNSDPGSLSPSVTLHFDTYFSHEEFVPADLLPPGTPGRFTDSNVLNRALYLGLAPPGRRGDLTGWLSPVGPAYDGIGQDRWPEHFWIIHNCNPRVPGTPFDRNRTALAMKSLRRSVRVADLVAFEMFGAPGRGANDLEVLVFGPMGSDEWHFRGLVISYRYQNAWRRLYANYRENTRFREGARNDRVFDLRRQAQVGP
ncbi:MAG: LamG domain-containing protein [Verrucomicrobia bacterium]|nr:LamG domain-containing protein [Verrucomicrobiota bacterium]